MATTSASSSMATASYSISSSSSSRRVRRLLHRRVASAVFAETTATPSRSARRGSRDRSAEEGIATDCRVATAVFAERTGTRSTNSSSSSSSSNYSWEVAIFRLIVGHRLRFLLLHLLEQIRLLHRRVATAVFAEITGTRSRSARTGSRDRSAEEGIATAATPLLPLRPITGPLLIVIGAAGIVFIFIICNVLPTPFLKNHFFLHRQNIIMAAAIPDAPTEKAVTDQDSVENYVEVTLHLFVRALMDDPVVDLVDDSGLLEIDDRMDHTVILMTMLLHPHILLKGRGADMLQLEELEDHTLTQDQLRRMKHALMDRLGISFAQTPPRDVLADDSKTDDDIDD
ncbi:hypothetical protein Syun_014195 [Stephania yunnanensis]|uniref:Uncharacterized protein n=1 Tax=Stephania yunnanensis TaxID=152371 RepID=A0AAP0JL01_9MAGN